MAEFEIHVLDWFQTLHSPVLFQDFICMFITRPIFLEESESEYWQAGWAI